MFVDVETVSIVTVGNEEEERDVRGNWEYMGGG